MFTNYNKTRMDKLINQIYVAKKTIKKATAALYVKHLNQLYQKTNNNHKPIKSFNWLLDYEKVRPIMDSYDSLCRRKALSAAALAGLTVINSPIDVYEKYRQYLNDVSVLYNDAHYMNIKSKKESENWTSIDDLMEILNGYIKKIKLVGINKKSILNRKEMKLLQSYLVASLYLLRPPLRNVYATLDIISYDNYNKLSNEDKENNNYLVIKSRNTKWFSFGDYKTKKTYGMKFERIQPKLNSVINLWRKFNLDAKHLLYNNRNKKLSKNGLTKLLNRVFAGTGKKISTSMLRHIYVSRNVDNKKFNEMRKLAKQMNHSVITQNDIYYKN